MSDPIHSLPKVELRPAFEWTCDCGRDNFEHIAMREATPAELAEMTETGEYDPDDPEDSSEMISVPIDVKCIHCGKEYEAEFEPDRYMEDEDADDEDADETDGEEQDD